MGKLKGIMNQTEWIPTITGKHPEEYQSVYVTAETDGPFKILSIYEAIYEKGEYISSSNVSRFNGKKTITAWMPRNVPAVSYIPGASKKINLPVFK